MVRVVKHESMLQAYRLLVPYFFTPDDDDKLLLTAFNRDYQEIPRARIRFKRNPSTFRGVWLDDSNYGGSRLMQPSFYMYNDNPQSREDYWERLGKLYSHKHIVVGEVLPHHCTTLEHFNLSLN